MTETLKPCPFCGGEAVLIEPNEHWSFYHVHCVNECCIGWKSIEASFFVADEAIAAWNSRVDTEYGGIPATEENMAKHGWVREEIVRCKDCKHYNAYQDLCERLKPGMVVTEPSFGFCAWGVKRKEGE